jgi:predicted transcriptional regulator
VRKQSQSVYLEPEMMAALAAYAARRGQSRSIIVEAALASFLSPDDDERREAVQAKRMDAVDRRLSRVERDVGINVEMMALFIRFWLSNTPTLSEGERAARQKLGGDRYDGFVAALGRRLAKGPKVYQELSEDVAGQTG